MRKTILEKRLNRLMDKRNKIANAVDAATEVNEVRSLTEQLSDLDAEISETRDEIAAIEAENRSNEPVKVTDEVPEGAAAHGKVVSSTRSKETAGLEYRKAFMKYVQNGTPIPKELRDDTPVADDEPTVPQMITTDDTGVLIPVTVMRQVINTVKSSYGNLYNKVTKLSVQGGVEFPIGELEASFRWIGEDEVSEDQELKKLGKVSFGYHTAELRIAQSFLSAIVTLSLFEEKIAEVIAKAYVKAMDAAIIKGSGDGQPLGIVNDERITKSVAFTAKEISDWTTWRKKFFAKLPIGYRKGEFIFSQSTVDSCLETMADSNNNPVFRQAADLDVNEDEVEGRFFGRAVSIVEPELVADFDTAEADTIIGIYWQPEEYAVNENYGFTMRRYFDENTNKWINKALVVVDGKVLNPTGYVLIKKA